MRRLAQGPLGVEVCGLDLRRVERAQVEGLVDLLARHGVVVLTDQAVDDTEFVAFLRRFGRLTFTRGETPVPGHPDLNVVTNAGRAAPPRSSFHVDTSYVAHPPVYSALRAVTVPSRGGATQFTDQYAAYDTLTAELRDRLGGRTIRHVATGVDLEPGDEAEAEHPVFLRHPVSGRTALYLSTPQRCVAVSGMTATESAEAVAELYRHATRDDNVSEHRWAPGDLVMWDNRCVLHRADHADVVGDRVLHRGLVAG